MHAMRATRLDIRLPQATKDLIQHAADLRHQSVTQFVIATLSEEAGKIVEQQQQIVLSNHDRDKFLQLLEAPPKPNPAFQQAAMKYKQRHGG